MKKLILLLIFAPCAAATSYLYYQYSNNPTSQVPYPYSFSAPNNDSAKVTKAKIEAPILIIGDRMGKRFASFSKFMADQISVNLSTPIKIKTLATNGEGIHRTFQKVKELGRLPFIIIYLGGVATW